MFSFLKKTVRKNAPRDEAAALYGAIVAQARTPALYLDGGVPDTENGRLEAILLHVYLVVERLSQDPDRHGMLQQALFDHLMEDLETNLREMSYGDSGVRVRVQKVIEGFYGRAAAYRQGLAMPPGLATNEDPLAAPLRRNLYRRASPTDATVASFCAYLRCQAAHLAALDDDALATGKVSFKASDLGP